MLLAMHKNSKKSLQKKIKFKFHTHSDSELLSSED